MARYREIQANSRRSNPGHSWNKVECYGTCIVGGKNTIIKHTKTVKATSPGGWVSEAGYSVILGVGLLLGGTRVKLTGPQRGSFQKNRLALLSLMPC